MKKYNIIILFLIAINLQAQNKKNDTSILHKAEFKIGYFGNFIWDNGINIGMEYPWLERTKNKKSRRKEKEILKQVLFNANIGYKTNFLTKTDNGGSTYFGLIWRRTNPKGKQLSFELNPLGYYRSFLPETYRVEGNRVSKVTLPGRSYYSPSFAIGIGKIRKGKSRSGWYLNLQYALRTPFNASTMPILSVQYGYRFKLKK